METTKAILALLSALPLLAACEQLGRPGAVELGDLAAPELQNLVIESDGSAELSFNEAVWLEADSVRLASLVSDPNGQNPLASRLVPISGGPAGEATERLAFRIEGDFVPGREYALELAVRDAAGNSLNLILPFHGPNPDPPRLVFNEVLTQNSTRNREFIELRVIKGGQLGGTTVFVGVPLDYDACYTFPPLWVDSGDYLLLHCKPEGKPEEVDEDGSAAEGAAKALELSRSGGLNASPKARDFWWRDAPGLGDDTGLLSLSLSPLGKVHDAVFYTDKSTVAGKDYRSFGTRKLMERVDALVAAGAWMAGGGSPAPEDGARSGALTATRSLGRAPDSADSDHASDWRVAPSGGLSPGEPNAASAY